MQLDEDAEELNYDDLKAVARLQADPHYKDVMQVCDVFGQHCSERP